MEKINKMFKSVDKKYKFIIQILMIVLLIIVLIPNIKIDAEDETDNIDSNVTVPETDQSNENNTKNSQDSLEKTRIENSDSAMDSSSEVEDLEEKPTTSTVSVISDEEPEIIAFGNHGTDWKIYKQDGEIILEICTGELNNISLLPYDTPWGNYLDTITKVIIQEDVIAPSFSRRMFAYLSQVTEFEGIENLNTENVIDMSYMFYKVSSITSLDLTSWDTRNTTEMGYMFSGMESLNTLNVSNWETKNVTLMNQMFSYTYNLVDLNISEWNVENVISMQSMFRDAQSLKELDLSEWNIKSMGMYAANNMFFNAKSLTTLNIKNWNTDKIKSSANMFSGANSLRELILGTNSKFSGSENLPPITSQGYNGKWMGLQTGTVFNSSDDFMNNYAGEADTYIWQPNSVDMGFYGTWWRVYDTDDDQVLELYTGELDDMPHDLNNTRAPWIQYFDTITKVIIQKDVIAPEVSYAMFENLSHVREFEGIENLNTENVTDMSFMFYGMESITSLDLSSWETKNIHMMMGLFARMKNVKTLKISNWNTEAVWVMDGMFDSTYNLADLDISSWDVGEVVSMHYMFYDSRSLTQLDLSNWDTRDLRYVQSMFGNTENLTNLNIKGWDMRSVSKFDNMFKGADKLSELTLGENCHFNSSVNLPAITTNGYLGKWVGVNTDTTFDSSSSFMNDYTGETDTYVWQKDILNITIPINMMFENEGSTKTSISSEIYEIKNNSLSVIQVELNEMKQVSNVDDIESLKLNDVLLVEEGVATFDEAVNMFMLAKDESGTLLFSGESKAVEEEVNPKFNLVFKFSFPDLNSN